MLLRNILNLDYFTFMTSLQVIGQEVRNRARETIFYECDISSEDYFTGKNEPVDDRDFTEFEESAVQAAGLQSSSLRDVLRPPKKYFAIVGPDTTDLGSLQRLNFMVATI